MEKVLGQLWYGIAGFCAGILVRFFYDVIHGLWRKRTSLFYPGLVFLAGGRCVCV